MSRPSAFPGWRPLSRAVLGIVAFGLLGIALTQLMATMLSMATESAGGNFAVWGKDAVTGQVFLGGLAAALGFLGATRVVAGTLGLSFHDLRWKGAGSPVRGALIAFLAGVVLAGLVMAGGALAGSARWVGDEGTLTMYIGRVALLLVMLAPAAWAEEIVFRGVPIVMLDRVAGRGLAVGITALLFALAHAPNPSITTLSIGNICIAGLLLGVAFFAPGGIWTAAGLHLGWNWGLAALDAKVSGFDLKIPFLDYLPGEPVWLTGGPFGPEGGVLATLVLGLATVVAGKLFLGRRDPAADPDGSPPVSSAE